VTRDSLIAGYQRLRERLPASCNLTEFDAAVSRLMVLPHANGHFTQPIAPDVSPSVPPTRALSPEPTLAALGMTELTKATSCGALRPLDSATAALASLYTSAPPAPMYTSAPRTAPSAIIWHRLFAVWRSGAAKGKKARLIADLRPSNRRIPPPPHFTLPSFATALPWATCKWAAKLDLDSAYWSVAVSKELQEAMSTVLPDGTAVTWSCLPFGLSWAPYIFTVALDPIVAAARALGFHMAKYLDDFVVAAERREDCAAALAWLRRELHLLGFSVSEAKTSPEPTQRLVFLGLGVDLEEQVFYWPRDKAIRCAEEASALIDAASSNPHRRVPADRLRSFLGRLAFLATVCPPLALWQH
jgi:Reverse transcriptase (RNA-dependent DNA polymerase)